VVTEKWEYKIGFSVGSIVGLVRKASRGSIGSGQKGNKKVQR
jgi:hypothetical protein